MGHKHITHGGIAGIHASSVYVAVISDEIRTDAPFIVSTAAPHVELASRLIVSSWDYDPCIVTDDALISRQ